MGDCRPLSQRQCAHETRRRAGFRTNRPGVPPKRGSTPGCAAERSGTGRNRSSPRLVVDFPRAGVKIGYAETIATWTIELDYGAKFVVNNTTTHGTARFRASELIEQSLSGRTPTAYDEDADGNRIVNQPETVAAREKQQLLKDRFRDWVWEDRERAARLAQEYNFRFNNIRLRDFDGSHLTLPGMVRTSLRDGDLASHQKNAVWRILQGGSPLLAHVVGAGKTWTMTAAAMELRRLDLAKKPMFIVPNHLVD